MHLYGLIIGVAILIGFNYFFKYQQILKKNDAEILAYLTVLFAVIGARVYHVVDQFDYYYQNPGEILATWNGGLGIFGGIVGAFVFILIFSWIKKISVIKIVDLITPILPLCLAIGRLGNFVNGEIPFWWVEALADVGLYLFIRRYPKNPTSKYLVGYGLIRFFFEFLRDDTWVVGTVKIGQIISMAFMIVGLWLLRTKKLEV